MPANPHSKCQVSLKCIRIDFIRNMLIDCKWHVRLKDIDSRHSSAYKFCIFIMFLVCWAISSNNLSLSKMLTQKLVFIWHTRFLTLSLILLKIIYFCEFLFQSLLLYILQPFQTFNFTFWFDDLWNHSHYKTKIVLCHFTLLHTLNYAISLSEMI